MIQPFCRNIHIFRRWRMNQKIEELMKLMPYLKEMTGIDAQINIWDTDGVVLGNFPLSKFEMPFYVGYQLADKSDVVFEVMKTGRRVFNTIPEEVFGYPIEGYITPIKDGAEVVGCVTYVFPAEQSKVIKQQTESLN